MKVDIRQWWDPNPDGYPQTNKTKQRNKKKTNQFSLSLSFTFEAGVGVVTGWHVWSLQPTLPPFPFSQIAALFCDHYTHPSQTDINLSLSLSNKHYSLSNAPKQHIILSNAHTQTQTHANIFFSFASLCVCLFVCVWGWMQGFCEWTGESHTGFDSLILW